MKSKLAVNYGNVKRAFLDLDKAGNGSISPEELAKLFKYGSSKADASGDQTLDYSTLEYLIKLRTKQTHSHISYAKFCEWFGSTIAPTEAFYFRHDSHKNPQYDINMQKSVVPVQKA